MSAWISIPAVAAEMSTREREWLTFQRLAAEGVGSGRLDQWAWTGHYPAWLKNWRMIEVRAVRGDTQTRLTFFGALVANEILKTYWPTGFLRSYFAEPRGPRVINDTSRLPAADQSPGT